MGTASPGLRDSVLPQPPRTRPLQALLLGGGPVPFPSPAHHASVGTAGGCDKYHTRGQSQAVPGDGGGDPLPLVSLFPQSLSPEHWVGAGVPGDMMPGILLQIVKWDLVSPCPPTPTPPWPSPAAPCGPMPARCVPGRCVPAPCVPARCVPARACRPGVCRPVCGASALP